jgi:hypothetical protein
MNFEDIQKAWVSPVNKPSEHETMKLKQELINGVRRRRRFDIIWLIQTSVMLIAATVVAIIAWRSGRSSSVAEWGAVLLLAVSWTCFLLIAWKRFIHRMPAAAMDQPISVAVRVALHDNRVARVINTVCVWLLALTVTVLPIVMSQLHAAGKASNRELLSMSVAFGVILLLFGAWLVWNRFRRLRPERERLEALLDPAAQQ